MARPKPIYKPIKPCSKCKIEKSLSEFPKSAKKYDGHAGICKKCNAIWAKKWYHADLDLRLHRKKYVKEYRAAGRKKIYKYPKEAREYTARQILEKPWQVKANKAVNNAIAAGKMERKPCEICGKPRALAHHDSYLPDQIFNVRWFCRSHHLAWHRLFLPEIPSALTHGILGK